MPSQHEIEKMIKGLGSAQAKEVNDKLLKLIVDLDKRVTTLEEEKNN